MSANNANNNSGPSQSQAATVDVPTLLAVIAALGGAGAAAGVNNQPINTAPSPAPTVDLSALIAALTNITLNPPAPGGTPSSTTAGPPTNATAGPPANAAPAPAAPATPAPAAPANAAPAAPAIAAPAAPANAAPVATSGPYYAVFRGRRVGVFQGWHRVSGLVTGVSGASYVRLGSREAAEAAFSDAEDEGNVAVVQ